MAGFGLVENLNSLWSVSRYRGERMKASVCLKTKCVQKSNLPSKSLLLPILPIHSNSGYCHFLLRILLLPSNLSPSYCTSSFPTIHSPLNPGILIKIYSMMCFLVKSPTLTLSLQDNMQTSKCD